MAKNKSPGLRLPRIGADIFDDGFPAPRRISPPQASATNFKERSSTKSFQQKRRGDDGGDGFVHRSRVAFTLVAGVGVMQGSDLEHSHFCVVQGGDVEAVMSET